MIDKEYSKGWRYIVWIGGVADYYTTYERAKEHCDEWIKKGYEDIKIKKLKRNKNETD